MRVLLLKDVYKLGRAGDVKRVADGYGRNYLIPQGMAVLATPGALKQVAHIKSRATVQRAIINKEMDAVAQRLTGAELFFSMKASETGKLYGSVTLQMITDALKEKVGVDITRRQIGSEPIRALGEFDVDIRLTVDLIPSVKVFVYREGEAFARQVATSAAPAPLVEASAPEAETPTPEAEDDQPEVEAAIEPEEAAPETEDTEAETAD